MAEKLNDEQKALVKQLESNNPASVKKSLESIRESGNVHMLSAVFDLYQRNLSADLQSNILQLVMDVKERRAPEFIAKALSERKWESGLSELLSAIWQSGLDYGAYLTVFIPFVKSSDMNVAMEALTCIEEFFYNDSVNSRDAVRDELKQIAIDSNGHHRDLVMIYLNNLK